MLGAVHVELHALGVVARQQRVERADLLDVAAIAREPRVCDDDAVEGALLGAEARQSDLE